MVDWTPEDLELLERTITEAIADSPRQDVSGKLAVLGWSELASEPFSSAAMTAVRAIALAQGRQLAHSDALHRWALNTLELPESEGLALALPMRGSRTALLLPGSPEGDIITAVGARDQLSVVRVARSGLDLPVFDPHLELAKLDITASPAILHSGRSSQASWELVEAMVSLFIAQAIVGVSFASIELAVNHVSSRRQFGQPLGAFQAVQHQLAEAFSWTTGLNEVCRSLFSRGFEDSAAQVTGPIVHLAERTVSVSNHATQQVHGAIGFTEEYPLHEFLKRNLTFVGIYSATGLADRGNPRSAADLWSLLDLVEA